MSQSSIAVASSKMLFIYVCALLMLSGHALRPEAEPSGELAISVHGKGAFAYSGKAQDLKNAPRRAPGFLRMTPGGDDEESTAIADTTSVRMGRGHGREAEIVLVTELTCCCKVAPHATCMLGKNANIKLPFRSLDKKDWCCVARKNRGNASTCDLVTAYKTKLSEIGTPTEGAPTGNLPRGMFCPTKESPTPSLANLAIDTRTCQIDPDKVRLLQRTPSCGECRSYTPEECEIPPRECDSSQVASMKCKAVINIKCTLGRITSQILPGVKDTNTGRLVYTAISVEVAGSVEAATEASTAFTTQLMGGVATVGLGAGFVGVFNLALKILADVCLRQVTCSTKGSAFMLALGILGICLVMTGVGTPVAGIILSIGGPIAKKIGELVCEKGLKKAYMELFGNSFNDFTTKVLSWGFDRETSAAYKIETAGLAILKTAFKTVAALIKFILNFLWTMVKNLWATLKGVLKLVPVIVGELRNVLASKSKMNATRLAQYQRACCCEMQQASPQAASDEKVVDEDVDEAVNEERDIDIGKLEEVDETEFRVCQQDQTWPNCEEAADLH